MKMKTLQAIAWSAFFALAPGLTSCTSNYQAPRKSYSAVCSDELRELGIAGNECALIKGYYERIDPKRLSQVEQKWLEGMTPEKSQKIIEQTGSEKDKKVIRAVCNIQNPSSRDYVFIYHYLFDKYSE